MRAYRMAYWLEINDYIEWICKFCRVCQMHRPARQKESLMAYEITNGDGKHSSVTFAFAVGNFTSCMQITI